jgi:soluble lytic murein transglycosylase-like protein
MVYPMDILAEISAVQSRIAEITGVSASADTSGGAAFGAALTSALGDGTANSPFPPSAAGASAAASLAPAPVAPEQIDSLVGQNAATWQVDPSLVKAIIANESGFNANATSKVGAQGLMQLMPSTAASVGVRDSYDPGQNVAGGTRYLKGLLDRFNGDVRLAVAAYNAGPGAVEKYGDVPPYAETQNYVQNVLGSYAKYRSAP